MSDEFANLSDLEIVSLIHRANEELVCRKEMHKETLKADIEQKLRKAGLDLADLFPELGDRDDAAGPDGKASARATRPVPAKYKNHASGDSWSGRGARPPQWVRSILAVRGWTIEQFKASEEFQA
jgi:DNA-binding protein H-NS